MTGEEIWTCVDPSFLYRKWNRKSGGRICLTCEVMCSFLIASSPRVFCLKVMFTSVAIASFPSTSRHLQFLVFCVTSCYLVGSSWLVYTICFWILKWRFVWTFPAPSFPHAKFYTIYTFFFFSLAFPETPFNYLEYLLWAAWWRFVWQVGFGGRWLGADCPFSLLSSFLPLSFSHQILRHFHCYAAG